LGGEWWLGDTPIGGFSISLEGQVSAYMDFIKERASYRLADRSTEAKRARNLASVVGSPEAKFSLHWFPWEAVECQIGYDFFAFFNTYASPSPIDFDYGQLNPTWKPVNRVFQGIKFGIGFVF
jgi:hypothetical protein